MNILKQINRYILNTLIFVLVIGFNSCKNDTDAEKKLFQNCFLFKDARAKLAITKDTTLYFTIQSLSSIGERSTAFSLDKTTIGKDDINFIVPRFYTFKEGETEGTIAISLKHIDNDSLVNIVMNLQTDNCIGYVEDTIPSQSYKSIQINYKSIQL